MLDFHSFTTRFSVTGFAFLKEDLLAFSLAGFSRDLPKTTSAGGWDFIHRRTPWDSSSGHAGLESPKTLLLPSMTSLCWGFRNESGTMPVILVTAVGGHEAHGEGSSSRNGDMHGLDPPMPPEHDKKSNGVWVFLQWLCVLGEKQGSQEWSSHLSAHLISARM